jgi:hypothetical protein
MSAFDDFEEELDRLLKEWEALPVETKWLRERIREIGAIATAEEYIRRDTAGLEEAYRRLGARKTLEALVIRFDEIFDTEIVALARTKLRKLGSNL